MSTRVMSGPVRSICRRCDDKPQKHDDDDDGNGNGNGNGISRRSENHDEANSARKKI